MKNTREAFTIKLIFVVLFSIAILTGTAASWSDETPPNCGPCQGGITTLTLQYLGKTTVNVVIQDINGSYFSGTVTANQRITITGTNANGTFKTNQVDVVINGVVDSNIDVICGKAIFINSVFGRFKVTAGASKQGGPLCCVSNTADTTPPVIQNCPQNIQATVAIGTCGQTVTWTPPVASDDCALSNLTSTHSPGENFPVGITDVVYTATDASNNSATCTFQVTVKDKQNPVFQNCPNDIVAHTTGTVANVNWSTPTVSDNCGGVTVTNTHSPGESFGIGLTTVSYTATDNSGNSASCNFTITVVQVSDSSLHAAAFLTPDGDGVDDVWMIENIDGFAKNSVTIVDRWGNVIFTASPYDNQYHAWDGTDSAGKKVAAGTYFYSLNPGDGAHVKKGFIEVIH